MEYLPLKKKFLKLNQEITSIHELLIKFKENIIKIKNEEIKDEINKFKHSYELYYSQFIGLKRFSIPIFGKISSGKSTLLNYILNLHGIFETNYNVSTRFVCIIRHNPNLLDGPKIYNVSVSERGEYIKDGQKIKLWNFEKEEEIKGNIKEIIEKRNHALGKSEFSKSDWKKYFMILEANIPLFREFNYRFSELFEFMDIPGLNEYTNNNDDINKQFYYKELIPFFIYNVGFSLFIFDAEKQESDASINIINNIMTKYFNNDQNKQKNSIFILNKIDKIANPKEELNNLKILLNKYLKCHIEKNGYFIGLSALLLYLKRFKYESFFDYLFCIIEEYNSNEMISIEEYIIKKMQHDFNIKIEENYNIDDDEEMKDFPIEQKQLLDMVNDKAINKGFKGELSINNYIYYNETFLFYSKNKKEELGEQNKNFESLLTKSFNNTINDYLGNYNNEELKNKLMKELELKEKDLEKLEIKDNSTFVIDNPISLLKSLEKIIIPLNRIEPDEQYIKDMSKKYKEILSDIEQKKIRIPLLGEYSSGKSSLLNSLIGHDFNILPVDKKVCTNIALVVKYVKDIKNISLFHTFLEKTNQNFYFFKSDKTPLVQGLKPIKSTLNLLNVLYKEYKDNEIFQNNILKFIKSHQALDEEDFIYCIDNLTKVLKKEITLDSIYDTDLKNIFEDLFSSLNQKDLSINNSDFFQRAFFLLNINIEAYDLMNLSDDIKEKVELIDFPGLDSINNIFKSEVLKHLIQFSDGFIFVNKGNTLMESEKCKILNNIIQMVIKYKRFDFSFKSCLFVLNKCDEVDNIDIEECKKEYERIFEINKREKTWSEIIVMSNKLKDSNNLNITKFSNTNYNNYKYFMNKVQDFDSYLKEYEIKIGKKDDSKKYLQSLKKKIYVDVVTISKEKYMSFKNKPVDIKKYLPHFQIFLKDEENKKIIQDIIKMYIFIRDSISGAKYYEKSNAKYFLKNLKIRFLLRIYFLRNILILL